MKAMVMGDVHGAYKALDQCLKRSGFNYENDILVQLGDVTDGYPEVYECVEELLKIKQRITLKGNHDVWFDEFIKTGFHPFYWTYGGKGTLISYLKHAGKKNGYFASRSGFKTSLASADIPISHKDFFNNQQLFHIDHQKRCFVHAGFNRNVSFYKQRQQDYYWDRTLWKEAMEQMAGSANKEKFDIVTRFKEIYIGHSPTIHWGSDIPLMAYNIINMDTGAGHDGRLTIMDIDTKEFWQSDPLSELYVENFRN